MPDDISATERMVRDWQDRATEKAERFSRMQEQVGQISVTESSRSGGVRVTVGSNGLLQHLELSEPADKQPLPKLAAEIMRTVQVAQAKIPELMQQAISQTVGDEDPAAQYVLEQTKAHFPEPPEEEDDGGEPEHGQAEEIQVAMDDEWYPDQR